MPLWSRSSRYSASSKWTEEVAMPPLQHAGSEKDHSHNGMPTPATSTAADTLPVPVLQNGSPSFYSRRRQKKSARVGGGLTVHWARFKRRIGTVTAPSTSSLMVESAGESNYTRRTDVVEGDQGLVDEVVVDRAWSEEIKSSVSHSEHGASPEKSGSHQQTGASDHESLAVHDGFWGLCTPLIILRWRAWPAVMEFFSSRFMDEKSEQHYAMEYWFLRKSLALWSSLWIAINWVLGCAFVPQPFVLMDKIFYFGVAPALSLPVGVMVMYDWPRDRPILYQCFLVVSVWCWSFYQVLYMFLCGFYSPPRLFQCGSKDFLGTFYYTTALQTIALFGLKLNRFPATIGALFFFIFSCAAIVPERLTWARSMINFAIFHIFLIYLHYMREASERRLYTLRDQLKIQYKATQKAQVNERKAADSKRRLTSYVRVPLNTALLAVQNMEASGTVVKDQEIEFNALEGSLSMMSKVLNDVLDFNRMDSGKFESASRPYAFHQVMRSLFIPLRLATDARGLEFRTNLDPNIDRVARRAAYEAMGEGAEAISKHIKAHSQVDGVVTGDETRLRQIITNLASNACKFTPSGGRLTITTRLIVPSIPAEREVAEVIDIPEPPTASTLAENETHLLSATHLSQHNLHHGKPSAPLEWIVVRIEVTDTGYGIKPRDMAQSKLFSAFNQTEQGRQQGGKGTGLGLALVRQIVKLSGGRLGVRSKVGEGSTFWVELPLGVGRKTLITTGPPDLESDGSMTTDLAKVLAAAESSTAVPESMSNSLTMAVDAAALKASQMSPASTRSSSALHSLMEQGGRVELVLSGHGSHSPVPTRTLGDPSTGTHYPLSLPSLSAEDSNGNAPQHPPLEEESSSETVKQQHVERPTYLPLPSPRSFSLDSNPISPGSPCGSASPSSPLTNFDSNHPRGSPASNQANAFEPGLSVLVVDDDPLTRTLMKRVLTRLGCNVSTAENGEVALEMILGPHGLTPSSDASGNMGPILEQEQTNFNEEGKYAVVFLDNQMPVLSGLKTVSKLREVGRKDFVVGVTGNALLTDQKEYLDAGVDRVLTKPVLERSLRDMLFLADERRKRRSLGS